MSGARAVAERETSPSAASVGTDEARASRGTGDRPNGGAKGRAFERRARAVLPAPTPRWLRDGFLRYNRRLLERRFAAVRIAGLERFPEPGRGPLLVYLNHPAWWDPLVCAALVDGLGERSRRHVALIEAANLTGVLARLGFVGIEPGVGGARRLARLGDELVGRADVALWLTPQGRFADPRERPLGLRGGLARLARRLPEALAVPLAIEYPFLGGRKPEIRARVGEPLVAGDADADALEGALERTMDRLAHDVVAGDLAAFRTLIGRDAA